jgi:hypothetical protein
MGNLRTVPDVGVDFEFYGLRPPAVASFQQRQRNGALWTLGLKGGFQWCFACRLSVTH